MTGPEANFEADGLPKRPRVRRLASYVAECHRCAWHEEHAQELRAAHRLDSHLIDAHGITDEEIAHVG